MSLRSDGKNPRALGTNPRAIGTNPRATLFPVPVPVVYYDPDEVKAYLERTNRPRRRRKNKVAKKQEWQSALIQVAATSAATAR